jgi:hypothetical protein
MDVYVLGPVTLTLAAFIVQLDALLLVHESVLLALAAIDIGEALKLLITTGGTTVMVTLFDAVPPAPEQLNA